MLFRAGGQKGLAILLQGKRIANEAHDAREQETADKMEFAE